MGMKIDLNVVEARGHYRCIYLNNHRITGRKPYVSEGLHNYVTASVDIDDLGAALVGTGYRLISDAK